MDQEMVSTFMEITSCESQAYALQHLASCRWNLQEAINLYFNSGDVAGASGVAAAPMEEEQDEERRHFNDEVVERDDNDEEDMMKDDNDEEEMEKEGGGGGDEDDVRAPIPARVEALYEDYPYYYGSRRAVLDEPSIWEAPSWAPVPVLPVYGTEVTGWGEEETGDVGEAAGEENVNGVGEEDGVENVVNGSEGGHDDAQEEEDGQGTFEEDTMSYNSDREEGSRSYSSDKEGETNMSYNSEDEVEDYGLEMDEDADYYGSIMEDDDVVGGQQQPSRRKTSLAELFRAPVELMYRGSFHDAKVHAARQDRFLLVSLQTRGDAAEFASNLQNRDLWADEAVGEVVRGSFVFLLLQKAPSDGHYGDDHDVDDECAKVATFYKLEAHQLPAVLLLDSITGQLLARRSGAIQPGDFLQMVEEYAQSKPSTLSKPAFVRKASASAAGAAIVEQKPEAPPESSAAAVEREKKVEPEAPGTTDAASAGASSGDEPAAPVSSEMESSPAETVDDDEEPMEGEKMYRLRVRFPDGAVVAREFGCKRRVASLFAFCRSTVRGGGQQQAAAAAEGKALRIMRFAGRAFEEIENGGATFEELRLNCATVSVVFDS